MSEPKINLTNPFSIILDRLWSCVVEGHQPLRELIKPGNQIVRLGNVRPDKRRVQDGDFPELDIIPVGIDEPITPLSSQSVKLSQVFEFGISSGSKDLGETYFPVKWELLRSVYISSLRRDDKVNLGLSWVSNIQIISLSETDEDEEKNRKRDQWTGLLDVSIDMIFNIKKHLLADTPDFLEGQL